VQLAGLGVDEVGGEGPGIPSEQRVRQRHVAPEEADVCRRTSSRRGRRRAGRRCRAAAPA
jgi:hypothetical protein